MNYERSWVRVFYTVVVGLEVLLRELFRFLTTFPNEVMPNLEFFPKNAHFVQLWCNFYLQNYICCRYLLRQRAFETVVQVALANRRFCGPAFIFLTISRIIFEIFIKINIANEILMKNDDFRGVTHGV